MSEIRKVPPSAGAEWLLGGFGLLARSPFGLGTLGMIFGALGLLSALAAQGGQNALGMALQLLFVLIGPLLLAGMVYAAREVDEGRSAAPAHLLRGVRDGKAGRLIGTLIPQFAAMVVLIALLIVVVGPTELQAMAEVLQKLQGQANPDPALVSQLPLGRLMLWLLLAVAVGVVAGFFTFTAVPDMMFGDVGLFAAMRRSFRACLRNLGALLVFFLLTVIAVFALNIAVVLLGLLVQYLAGETAMTVVVQLAMMAVLMPVMTGAMYVAWKQMLGPGADAPRVAAGIEV
ncbi:MAG TPA: BPSS1780 family membrane protein [Lysobacter sp.]|nr:BPSS1780 family membrane protein [Lysobacter sp.]